MSIDWPVVRLGDLLRLDLDKEPVEIGRVYPMVGVLSFGKGLFIKENVDGDRTSYRVFYRLAAEHVVMSQLFGWEGALAVSGPRFAGRFVSPMFPTFRADPNRIDHTFLKWWLKRPAVWRSLGSKASGMGDRRRTLNPAALLSEDIALPPLAEQRRIVARLDALSAKIEEAKGLRASATATEVALKTSILQRVFSGDSSASWRREQVGLESATELLERISVAPWPGQVGSRKRSPLHLPLPPSVPKQWRVCTAGDLQDAGLILDIQDGNHGGDYPRKHEFGTEGVPFITAKQFDGDTLKLMEAPRLPTNRAQRLRIGFARGGDVLLTHNASVGDVLRAPVDVGEFLLGTSVTYWRCNPDGLDPDFLVLFMRSSLFQEQLRAIMKQTTRNQVSVLKQVNLFVVLPPILEQNWIVKQVAEVERQLKVGLNHAASSAENLNALVPSLLDRAFVGVL